MCALFDKRIGSGHSYQYAELEGRKIEPTGVEPIEERSMVPLIGSAGKPNATR